MTSRRVLGAALLAGLISYGAQAAGQPVLPTTTPLPPAPTTPEAAPPASPAAPHLSAGMPVEIEITEAVSSKTGVSGATFGLRLAKPILYEGRVVVPAGVVGQGEVVDAHRSGMAGRPGELIIAARFVDDAGVRIPLKALKLGLTGRDNGDLAMAVGIAAGMAAIFVPGGEIVIPPGTHAVAKLKADIDLASLPPVPPEPAAAPALETTTPSAAPTTTSAPATAAPTPTSTSQQGHSE
jgi:hypothetical protein